MNYTLEIQKLLIKSANFSGEDKISILKQAVKLADTNNDVEWGYDLRVDIMNACMGAIKTTEALPAFVWMIEAYDNNPNFFDPIELLWKYRWMIDSSARSWKVPLDTINNMLEDFKVRLADAGISLRSYYGAKINVGFIAEDFKMVEENMELRNNSEKDNILDNFGNDLYDNILFKIMTKDTEGALALRHEIPAVPHLDTSFSINCSFGEYLTRIGEIELALPFIKQAEEEFSRLEKLNYLSISLSQLIYALTKVNPEAAWGYTDQYLNWIFECEDYDMLIYGLNLLPLFKLGGSRKIMLSHEFKLYRNNDFYHIEDLYNYFITIVSDLAAKFDTRNGNETFSNLVKKS